MTAIRKESAATLVGITAPGFNRIWPERPGIPFVIRSP
jgi:hypothetical protein